MQIKRAQSGQSLIQLMIVVAILGIMGMLVAQLMGKVSMGWLTQRLYSAMDTNAQGARRLLMSQMRDASSASVVLSRVGTAEPLMSKISWVDSSGSSRTVYQTGIRLFAANWSGSVTNVAQVQTVLKEGLERFQVYYPSAKDPSKVGFNLVLSKKVTLRSVSPVDLNVGGIIELKNP